MKTPRKIAFPRYAEYNCALKYFVEQGLDATYILQPALTRRTEELGAKYSPDFVCTPFKTLLGSMIESLEEGADTLFMTHGFCRPGYFGELQEQILRDLGYSFDFLNLAEYSTGKKKDWVRAIKWVNPRANLGKLTLRARDTIKMVQYLDQVTSFYYENCGFDASGGEYQKAYQQFISAMYTVTSKREIETVYQQTMDRLRRIPLDKPAHPLRVGVVGELYTVMDPFSNLELEQKLADMGVEIHRWMTLTNRLIHYPGEKNLNPEIRDLCTYEMGPTSTANIWCARKYAQQGFDGLIHIKSASCTPEIDIMPVLQNISTDYKIPLLCLTYDAQTSDVGLMTRLEAFYDMIDAKKRMRR